MKSGKKEENRTLSRMVGGEVNKLTDDEIKIFEASIKVAQVGR
jgi:hypothetical protein